MSEITIRKFVSSDAEKMRIIWNTVVDAANAFPQETALEKEKAYDFFALQTVSAVAEIDGGIAGLYILHPNNVGRCGHICNASYAVSPNYRGHGIGRKLVEHCLKTAAESGYRILQFNAVVADNTAAIKLYEKLGFKRLGTVKGGFRCDGEIYKDIVLFWFDLTVLK